MVTHFSKVYCSTAQLTAVCTALQLQRHAQRQLASGKGLAASGSKKAFCNDKCPQALKTPRAASACRIIRQSYAWQAFAVDHAPVAAQGGAEQPIISQNSSLHARNLLCQNIVSQPYCKLQLCTTTGSCSGMLQGV
jgi:hypothetical protein